jgi:peptidoglycan/LPS O-acetylase OafA/YrhL
LNYLSPRLGLASDQNEVWFFNRKWQIPIDLVPGSFSVCAMSDPSKVAINMANRASAVEPPSPVSPAQPAGRGAVVQSASDRSLDQWRGLALLLVLISHGFFVTGRVPGIGRAGVNLFFFVSGILVFRSLSRGPQGKWQRACDFWYRRTKRLVPAKYFYLLCMTGLVLIAGPPLVDRGFKGCFFQGLPSAFLYYRNYYMPVHEGIPENLSGHLWSLACEMQFYLLAPLIFYAGGASAKRRLAVYGGLLALFMGGGVTGVVWKLENPYTFQVAAWPMMAGFFCEFLRATYPVHCGKFGKPLAGIGALSLIALVPTVLAVRKNAVVLAGTLLVAGCLGCYLQGIAPKGWLGNAFHFLGNRTYSMYLWQQPLTIGGLMPAAWHPLGALLAIPLGALSFKYLERPFMSKYKRAVPAKNAG